MNSETKLLLEAIDQAYDHKSWHGTNLRGSVRGLDAKTAALRPAPGRHNIWEVVLHAAYWKYAVRRRLLGERRGSFPLKGSNWFTRPGGGGEWAADLALLGEMHRTLRGAIVQTAGEPLDSIVPGGKYTRAFLLTGIAAHDLYHAGQIQLLKKLGVSGRI